MKVGAAPTAEQAARRATYIVLRIELATQEKKRRLAEELGKLPSATDREWATRKASEAMAGDLNGIGAESFRSEAGEPPPSQAESVYAESREAVISVLAGVLKAQPGAIHMGNDLLQSVSDAAWRCRPAILDNIVPKNLRDVQSIRQWMAQGLRRAPPINVTAWNVEPDWNSPFVSGESNRLRFGSFRDSYRASFRRSHP